MQTKYLYLNSRDEFYRIDISKIVYFESEGNYTNFVLANEEKGFVCINLLQMQKILKERLKQDSFTFARVGKRFIINLNYVYNINIVSQKLLMSDGVNFTYKLPISKEALKKLRDVYISSLKQVVNK